MYRLTNLAVFLLFVSTCANAQTANDHTPTPVRTYSLLRDNEDWSFLKDVTLRGDLWDSVKFIPLRAGGKSYLTIGGEIREAFEHVGNDNWGKQAYMNAFFLERYMFHTDWHLGEHIRAFVQFKSGVESFRKGGPRPIDEKKLDFEAAYFEVGNTHKKNWMVLRVGRQELNYGSGRLVSVREGPNVRQSFDGVKIRSKAGAWNVDAWAVRPDLDKSGLFDNAPDHQTAFWGLYATRPWRRGISFDAYYVGEDRRRATFDRGTATELRHSLAMRLSRPIAAKEPGWDFDDEAVWQFGTFGSDDIRAWTVASDHGYSLPNLPLKPRFSVKADISSGDDPRSNTLSTFNPLFPKGNYFGVLATAGPGPINFIDLHPHIETAFPHSVTASFDWISQWRESLRDGVYSVPGFLIIAAGKSNARFVGHRPGMEVRWQANRHLWFQADYGIFYAGKFVKESQPGRNLNYWALWTGYKF